MTKRFVIAVICDVRRLWIELNSGREQKRAGALGWQRYYLHVPTFFFLNNLYLQACSIAG
jgi:hypothetical protein